MLIYVSDVAAAVGRNKYKPAWKVFEAMWRRMQPEQYAECVSSHASQDAKRAQALAAELQRTVQPQTDMAKAATTTAEVQQLVEQAQGHASTLVTQQVSEVWSGVAEGGKEGKKVFEQVQACATEHAVRQLMTAEQPVEVVSKLEQTAQLLKTKEGLMEQARQEVHCTFGTVREEASRQQVVEQLGDVTHDNKFHVMWMEYVLDTSGTRWGVGGRVDGMDAQGRVVEIKNRTRHFFYKVPDYEWVQVQAYLALLDVREAVLVQQLNGQQRLSPVYRDAVEWRTTIVPALYKFMNVLDLFISDDSYIMRQEWMHGSESDKASILSAWSAESCGSGDEMERNQFVF
jgi:hypothetical protein